MRKKALGFLTILPLAMPVVTVVACSKSEYQSFDLDLNSNAGQNYQKNLKESYSWSDITNVHYDVKGTIREGEIICLIEGLNASKEKQQVKLTARYDVFNEIFLKISAQINDEALIEDVYANEEILEQSQILRDSITMSTIKEAYELLSREYQRPIIEFVPASEAISDDLISNNWTEATYDQLRVIFPANSTVLTEILNAQDQVSTINQIKTNLATIEKEGLKRFDSINDAFENHPEFFDIDVFPSEPGKENDHLEIYFANIKFEEVQKMFDYKIDDSLAGKNLIIWNLIRFGLKDVEAN